MRRALAVAAAPLLLVLAGCGIGDPPAPEGLSAEQCDRLVPLTEDYLLVYLKDDWRYSADDPIGALSSVQRVAGKVSDAADELGTPETVEALERVREAYSAVVLLAGSNLDEPLAPGDPSAVADQHAVIDEVIASLSDCATLDALPTQPTPPAP